jgi:DNA invertase Pin-like site-specific DNA recombinase
LRDNLDLSTPSGRIMLHIIGAMAEFERELIKERVSAGMHAARKRGSRIGRSRAYTHVLTPATRRRLHRTSWADNQRTLLKLCKLLPEMQEEVARKVASCGAKEIYDALAKVYRDRAAATRCWLPLRRRLRALAWRFS